MAHLLTVQPREVVRTERRSDTDLHLLSRTENGFLADTTGPCRLEPETVKVLLFFVIRDSSVRRPSYCGSLDAPEKHLQRMPGMRAPGCVLKLQNQWNVNTEKFYGRAPIALCQCPQSGALRSVIGCVVVLVTPQGLTF